MIYNIDMIHNKDNEIVRRSSTILRLLRSCSVGFFIRMLLLLMIGGSTTLAMADGVVVKGNVYGGGNEAGVGKAVTVNISAGTVNHDVYGGGAKAYTNTDASTNTYYEVTLEAGTSLVGYYIYNSTNEKYELQSSGEAASGNHYYKKNETVVNLTGGTVSGDVYGGGLGEDNDGTENDYPANVYGDVTVNIGTTDDAATPIYSGDATIGGSVYGCNNANGSPQGNVLVNIYSTGHSEKDMATYTGNDAIYAIANVFGGGNQASYAPVGTDKSATVHVYGCNNTIEDVFGGGDAAAAYGVVTIIDGGRFGRVFGGGNGEVTAANIGDGGTDLRVHGGYIGQLFGGSNTAGNITGTMNVAVDHTSSCGENIAEFFGGSNLANLGADSSPITLNTTIGCGAVFGDIYGGCNLADIVGDVTLTITGSTISNVYGGSKGQNGTTEADAADIKGTVTLNLYGGTITNAFGGSNINGNITGKITVNVLDYQDTSCPLDVTNIYGAGNLTAYTPNKENNQLITSPEVNIIHIGIIADDPATTDIDESKPGIRGNVYGGGKGDTNHDAIVTANPVVNIGYDATNMSNLIPAGYIGTGTGAVLESADNLIAAVSGSTFGGGDAATVAGTTQVNLRKTNSSVGALFGGGNQANVTNTGVNVYDGSVTNNIYGGCNTSGTVSAATVTLTGGTTTDVYGSGKGSGTTTNTATVYVGTNEGTNVNPAYSGTATINGDVYGGSEEGAAGTTVVNLNSVTSLSGHVFGGGKGRLAGNNIAAQPATITSSATVNQNNITFASAKNIYGGCNVNGTAAVTSVYVMGGTSNDIFGGGFGPNTGVTGNVLVSIGKDADGTPTSSTDLVVSGNVYGGSAQGTVNTNADNTTTVNLWAGSIDGDVYGGGLGDATNPATVNGIAWVNLNGYDNNGTPTSQGSCVVKGYIFGGNYTNGSPAGTEVHIYKTIDYDSDHTRTAPTNLSSTTASDHKYNLLAVYGGGNLAEFEGTTTKVVIETCDPSIETVYGGGNAADATNTWVEVKGAYEIGTVFGGGNGETTAANVPGTATSKLYGGVIHSFYGGSNSNGIVGSFNSTDGSTGGTDITIDDQQIGTDCSLSLDNIYGAGKNAPVDGNISMTMGCLSDAHQITNLYGGAESANIRGGVTLTVTSGSFENVFGGNNAGGTIGGDITLNIEETGCKPLIIENVYGGGNAAAYTGNPTVNLKSFTAIGNVYGGGKGGAATVTGNPQVNINQTFGKAYVDNDPTKGFTATATTLGTIGNVFGGGEQAKVIGDVSINIGTAEKVQMVSLPKVDAASGDPEYVANATTQQKIYPRRDVMGVNIYHGTISQFNNTSYAGNVYGGGKSADIEGDVTITVGSVDLTETSGKKGTKIGGSVFGGGLGEDTKVTGSVLVKIGDDIGVAPAHNYVGYAEITGDVYGGSAKGKVNTTNGTSATANATTQVNLYGGTISGNLYGGGYGKDPETSDDQTYHANVYGNVTVGVYGGTTANVFGCNNEAGSPQGTVNVNINNTADTGVANVYGGGNKAAYSAPTATLDYPVVTLSGGTVTTNVYGGGLGETATVTGNPQVTLQGTAVTGSVFGGGEAAPLTGNPLVTANYGSTTNLYGGGLGSTAIVEGNPTVVVNKTADQTMTVTSVYGGGDEAGVTGNTTVTLTAGSITNAFGGGNVADITGTTSVTLQGATAANIYGGGNEASVSSTSTVTISSGNATTGVYGGCNTTGTVGGNITVNANGGTIGADGTPANVHGGGYGAGTETNGNVTVSVDGSTIWGDVYGGSALGNVNDAAEDATSVTLTSGTIHGDLYGGGLGDNSNEALVNGAVTVTVNGGSVTGGVFGCNNIKGAPQSTVRVDINGTDQPESGYALAAVYGGGNKAAYVGTPVVAVHNCNNSIEYVYGGGNAASVAATDVTIYGGNTIGTVFGGGNGQISAANVTGGTAVKIYGGTIGQVFGGSNSQGTIGGDIAVNINKQTEENHSSCSMRIREVYGGGNVASSNAGSITIGCTGTLTDDHSSHPENIGATLEGIGAVYGGANQADVTGDITLIINGGMVANVFGGNNTSGDIDGDITVNIEKNAATCGWYVGNVYGGGNLAAYSQKNDGHPVVNIKNGTVSGSVYGGGKGGSAVVTGNPIVTIGDNSNDDYCAIVTGNVYGGGDAAAVTGNTTVTYNDNHATSTVGKLFGGGNAAGVSGNATVNMNAGKLTGSVYGGCNASGTIGGSSTVTVTGGIVGEGTLTPSYTLTTKGNVFGGGYGKDTYVAGDVEVNIGTSSAGNAVIFGDVYGGGALGHVNAEKPTGSTPIPYTSGKTTTVNLNNGTIFGDAYGGGLGQKTGFNGATVNHAAFVGGDVVVNVNGAAFIIDYENTNDKDPKDNTKWIQALTSGRVFGCNNLNGYPLGDVTVTVNKTVKGNVERSSTASKTNDNATYEIAAVYGGGNLADYTPTKTGAKPYVIINDCDVSIKQVYGGGNAAEVPGTDVDVRGAYEIHQVFGGGNGADKYKDDNDWQPNPGANVNGSPNTLLKGGVIHEAYGGSNEKGITGTISIKMVDGGLASCPLDLGKMVVAGKNADTFGDVKAVMDCNPSSKTPLIYFGADNANVWGNVEMTITSGNFGKVFAGNNLGGAIFGHVILNIEETGNCPTPITIDELYLGGNQASYSIYGYYREQTGTDGDNNPIYVYKPRTSATDAREPYYLIDKDTKTVGVYSNIADFPGYAEPVLNVISATRIDEVFGGGYGEGGDMYANPTVNINMVPGSHAATAITRTALNGVADNHRLGTIGNVYGGGNAAVVYGNTTVNIGTESKVYMVTEPVHLRANSSTPMTPVASGVNKDLYEVSTEGAYITGNVYGGGKLADVTGNTFVNICAKKSGDDYVSVGISDDNYEGVTIGENGVNDANHGNVFGGGKGEADNFYCNKAMVGEDGKGVDSDFNDDLNYLNGNTSVIIGNGTINGNVYGGGEIGRVEKNTNVTIGIGDGDANKTSAPIIRGDVFGGGKGDKEHGYAALVRGNPTVIVQGDAKVGHSVYGAGEIASVARYRVPKDENEVNAAIAAGYKDAKLGMPYALANTTTHRSGYCTVKVQGNAEIGPDGMQMTKAGGPDDAGHVFAAGKGFLPEGNWGYNENDKTSMPKRMVLYDAAKFTDANQKFWEYVDPTDANNKNVWEYFPSRAKYIEFIQTQALASNTEVTIGDDNGATPFIKGSVYGGSENGLVQFDTKVYIKGGQIGVGKNTTERHPDAVWADNYDPSTGPDLECASWEYKAPYAPYDPYAKHKNATDGKYYYDDTYTKSAEGGAIIATDGHTYYGNVFGGGSGSVPYFDTTEGNSKYLNTAGTVKGNTTVEISGGHILTNVYGGCEATNVLGKATVKMSGGTIGVPRTLQQIIDHPVTCYLFGGGKGDQRIFFNKDTNVEDVEVQISGGRIYGSVFGGGEDGHVMKDVLLTIKETDETNHPTKIGTRGTSYVDGNIFGGGRGFGGDALTAGNIGGSVTVNIEGGEMLGSIYGGGRLASVGYGLYLTTEDGYGVMRPDNVDDKGNSVSNFKRGYITVNIKGGTIGNDEVDAKYGGNVFGGSMGRLTKLDGSSFDDTHWPLLATAKKTTVNINGGTIKRSVYGGGEMGTVTTDAIVNVSGGTIGTSGKGGAEFGNVYGGGKGYVDPAGSNYITAGIIKGNTKVTVKNGTNTTPTIYHNVYGGGAYGSVGTFTYDANNVITGYTSGGKAEIYITGGEIGTNGNENGMIFGSSRGDVGAPGSIHDKLAWVYDTHVAIGDTATNATITTATPLIKGSVYGGGENGHNYRNAYVRINGGTIGIVSGEPITENNGTPDDTTDDITYSGAKYPYRGNVYGGGCGTDKYYSTGTELHDGKGDSYNPKAGIVQGNAIVHITEGNIVHNVYGAGAMGSVGNFEKNATTNAITFNSGGTTTIAISGGIIGVDGTAGEGNVFGAARGDVAVTDKGIALVKETGITISGTTTTTQIKGNVYGGGEVGNVHTNTTVDIQGGAIARNVYGGGKGVEDLFTCEQAMVGVDGEGAGAVLDSNDNKNKGTIVTISNGTVGTLNGGVLVEGTGNVYGGGEIGRVEWNTQVKIGVGTGSGVFEPVIYGSVFGAGKGLETHGYSALVRGNSTVTVQGGAKVGHNVYGGGEKSTVGRYWVKGINNIDSEGHPIAGAPDAPSDLPDGMPYQQQSGGICRVTVQGSAQIGPDAGGSADAGNVFGAGKGVNPHFVESGVGASQKMTGTNQLVPFTAITGKTAEDLYLEFLQTLALVTNTYVTINGGTVQGSVYGGSESGFVQHNTDVDILGGTILGDAFGGGLGLASFAEAGKVKENTDLAVSGGTVQGNVYGGGSLGDVGTIIKSADYNYNWNQSDGVTVNAHNNNTITGTNNNSGICKVTISGGTIGIDSPSEKSKHGNVFGAGRGSSETWWCEKAIAYATDVLVTKGTVYGNVYGGGEVGRVEDDAKVTIGTASGTDNLTITGSVFGAGAGLATHGYSALVRGNSDVIVQGAAQIGGNVYGGGEIASVGKFTLDKGLPKEPKNGGTCTVKIQDDAKIGTSGTGHNVFGACKGVDPATISSSDRKSMQLYDNRPKGDKDIEHTYWDYYETYPITYNGTKFVWVYYKTEDEYLDFLKTLALTSNTHVTIGGNSSVYGSVYGGGERGITLGGVDVNMMGGTIYKDVYGGGSLADSNTAMWDADNNQWKDYVKLPDLIPGSPAIGYYTAMSDDALITDQDAKVQSNTTYYANYKTNVNLMGGTICGDAYGGGLGQLGTNPIEAKVYGDVFVNLGKANADGKPDLTAPATAFNVTLYPDAGYTDVVKSGRIFGCNNLNGSPQGNVTVTVNKTVEGNTPRTAAANLQNTGVAHTYELADVYGGGNLANYTSTNGKVKVIINSCDVSVQEVYGGGNAAAVPATDVLVRGAYEIAQVFGGGNGEDDYYLNGQWNTNPGANVGGDATTLLTGGYIHEAYGASNSKGVISGNINISKGSGGECNLNVVELYGAGKDADVEGDLIMVMGCSETRTEAVYGCARNANVKGNVELTITSGEYGKIFGGNNESGAIFGHIVINIEEDGCSPIIIGELYGCGNDAAYSTYGYYQDGTIAGKPKYVARKSMTDGTAVTFEGKPHTVPPYADPEVNIISCTSIGEVFGGGYGVGATVYGNPKVNINMIKGAWADKTYGTSAIPDQLGAIGDVFGGGNAASVEGNTTVNIGMLEKVQYHLSADASGNYTMGDKYNVEGANITGNVFGGGNEADVSGNTYVNICGTQIPVLDSENKPTGAYTDTAVDHSGTEGFAVSIGNTVYGGGNAADVLGNTFVTMADGYVFNGIFGGGLAGSVGTFTRDKTITDFGHTANHEGCIGKPTACKEGTGTCYVVVSGGQIGPVEVATEGMTRLDAPGGPVPQGWVWGAGCGIVEDPATHPDTHFKAYVNNTDVTIKDKAFILESIIGGGEFGRVLGNTLVKIEGGQIGVGAGQVDANGKPIRYTDDQFIDPTSTTTSITEANALATCSHFPFGKDVNGKKVYECYDPYADAYKAAKGSYLYPGGVTDGASDGKTWIGCVFAGGSGYMPYINKDESGKIIDYDWVRSAGWVEGNTEVRISGGHILTNVYGGNEYTDVKGTSKVIMTGGTIGVPRTKEQIEALPMSGYIFGAGKGDERTHFNTATNVGHAEVEISGGIVYGSVYGGGEDGHVLGDSKVTIKDGAKIGTVGTSYFDGNVFGGGRGFSGIAQTAGTVGGNVTLNIEGGTMYGSVYGGGRLASVGTQFTAPNDNNYGNFVEDGNGKTYGHVTVNISGGTIGNEKATGDGAKYSGNVFGGSMGRLDLLDGTRNLLWPKMAQVKNTTVNIYDNANIIRSVFGGGELGTVRDNAYVTIGGYKTADPDADGNIAVTKSGSPTVRRDVYGGGYGSEDRNYTIFTVNELENDKQYHPHTYAFTPMQFAGCVGQNTYVNVVGGYIRKSVYGGGELASVGVINYRAEKLNGASTSGKVVIHDKESGEDFFYSNMVKHEDVTKEFALSWPYEFNYVSGYEGATHVKVTGGRLGLKDGDTDTGFEDNGDVYGAGKGQAGDYKDFVFCANVGSTNVVIDHSDSNGLQEYSGTANLIAGAVYGGGEDGHVMGDTKLTMTKGFVYHSIYGGGSGKGTFTKWLTEIPEDRRTVVSGDTGSGGPETRVNEETHTKEYKATCYSITAGKVFGNTEVEMTGGTVVRNVYGGGNMASVGKGNYSGGPDDYSTSGYGETLPEGTNLWDGNNKYSQAFLNSGRCTVNITGGKVGYIGYDPKDPLKFVYPRDLNTGLPYGNVFGGCRGEAAPNILETPRYLYSPEFFLGYVNETIVNIGIADKPASGTVEGGDYVAATPASGPTIAGSVYGGGMDGHVRRDTKVTINGGVIGSEYTTEECSKVGTSDLNDIMWLHRGNVYGAGSGTGKYKFDLNYDGDYGDEIDYTTPSTQNSSGRATRLKEEDHSTSAGSVTRFTEVTINGGTIHRNVYGGGSLSSIGGPRIPPITSDPARKGDTSVGEGIQSLNKVTITNGTIGDAKSYAAGYGGYVFGASRGDATLDNPSSFAQSVWTDVNVKGGTIMGDVYGGGEVGSVRQSTEVTLKGGTIMNDAYGGGKGTANVEANVGGETLVKLNEGVGEDEKGCVVSRLFGGNNVNGTPGGKTQVYVYATQNKDKTDIKTKNAKHDGLEAEDATTTTYDVKAVYGGGNLSPYIPAGADGCAEVYIQGCDLTSIKQVYGGANSASTPATKVTVNSAYEIQDLFGGGDGQGSEFGANVGYLAYPASYDPPASSKEERTEKFGYGSGVASLNIYGGRIHRVFGGSNTKGNVRETAITMLDNQDPCELEVDEVYGGGKSAPMDAEAILHMACIPGLKVAYGGAQEADVLNNVVLNITNGTYDRIFGGNNISGTIKGSITVNIEETGCKPLIIGELYGGGNLAGYSVYGYNDDKSLKESGTRLYADPQINVKSFTSIGNIYGGGLGESAVMVGNPTVNINVVKGDYVNYVGDPTKYGDGYEYDDNGYKGTVKTFDGYDVTIPSHEKGKIGAIQNVFGGGNAAKVVGNTSVNVGTQSTVTLETKEDDSTTTDVDEKHPTVIGADIRGNVYGGGNNAEVTGNTDVVIGKKKTE